MTRFIYLFILDVSRSRPLVDLKRALPTTISSFHQHGKKGPRVQNQIRCTRTIKSKVLTVKEQFRNIAIKATI